MIIHGLKSRFLANQAVWVCLQEINSLDESGEGIKMAVSKPSTSEVQNSTAMAMSGNGEFSSFT